MSTRLSVFVVRKAFDTLFGAFKWKSYPNASRQDRNAPGQKTGITKTIVSTYRSQFGLLWRITLPVVLLAICVDIALFFRDAAFFTTAAESQGLQVEWRVNTLDGIDNTINLDTMDIPHLEWGFERRFGFLPSVTSTRDDGSAWTWSLDLRNFRNVNDYYYSLLLLVLCPLSFAVAQRKITARDTWRHTRRSIWTVLGTNLVLVLILDGISIGFSHLIPYILRKWAVFLNEWIIPMSIPLMFMVIAIVHCYLLVCTSLYNPCLMLEKHSVLSVFRRSYALVKGNWWRFFRIYLVTSWVASTLTSVLLGLALLLFSIVVPELAAVREILLPFNFFTLFLGANVEIPLANLPNVPTTSAIVVVRQLILALLVPIWAIVTTRLYLEKTC